MNLKSEASGKQDVRCFGETGQLPVRPVNPDFGSPLPATVASAHSQEAKERGL
jgi:hypothetical protein